jgi:hypothetical protein
MDQTPSPTSTSPRKRNFNTLRFCAWTLCGLALLTAVHLQKLLIDDQDEKKAAETLKTHILSYWDLEKDRVEKINTNAEKYIAYYHLQPGDPLPPNTFFEPTDPTWRRLNSPTFLTYSTAHKAEKDNYSTIATTLTAIRDTVPPKDEHYAYIGVIWNASLFSSGLEIYPQDKAAFTTLKKAHKLETKNHPHP